MMFGKRFEINVSNLGFRVTGAHWILDKIILYYIYKPTKFSVIKKRSEKIILGFFPYLLFNPHYLS